MVDDDGNKVVFVHGLPKLGAKPGRDYWGRDFISKALSVLNDRKSDIEEYNYSVFSSASNRREKGYQYARDNIDRLVSDIEEDESFKFVPHSMGAAFSEGMADYLREQGYTVDVMIHLSPFQASDIHSSGEREDVLTIDYQTKGDPVLMLGLFSQGTIGGADAIFRKEPIHGVKEMQYIHTEILSSSIWNEIMNAVNNFLQK